MRYSMQHKQLYINKKHTNNLSSNIGKPTKKFKIILSGLQLSSVNVQLFVYFLKLWSVLLIPLQVGEFTYFEHDSIIQIKKMAWVSVIFSKVDNHIYTHTLTRT